MFLNRINNKKHESKTVVTELKDTFTTLYKEHLTKQFGSDGNEVITKHIEHELLNGIRFDSLNFYKQPKSKHVMNVFTKMLSNCFNYDNISSLVDGTTSSDLLSKQIVKMYTLESVNIGIYVQKPYP